jgi:hypothetical protein
MVDDLNVSFQNDHIISAPHMISYSLLGFFVKNFRDQENSALFD